jgi:hypothetical protein
MLSDVLLYVVILSVVESLAPHGLSE